VPRRSDSGPARVLVVAEVVADVEKLARCSPFEAGETQAASVLLTRREETVRCGGARFASAARPRSTT
jgi:hypothetical protein